MLSGVGQSLLHDAVGGATGSGEQGGWFNHIVAQLHLPAGVAGLVDQPGKVSPRGLRPSAGLVISHRVFVAQQADDFAELVVGF